MKPLHAALRHLVNASHGPMDRRLKRLAGHESPAPAHEQEGDDESELHAAVMSELNGDGKPHGLEQSLKEGPPVHKEDVAVVSKAVHEVPPTDAPEKAPEPHPSPADTGHKRKRGVRF